MITDLTCCSLNFCELRINIKTAIQNDSLAGCILVIKSSLLFFFRTFSRPFAQTHDFHRGMLGLWAWGDGLNDILFEFLDDDTKLAQSCRNWLYVQHWYVVAPDHVPYVVVEIMMVTQIRHRCLFRDVAHAQKKQPPDISLQPTKLVNKGME